MLGNFPPIGPAQQTNEKALKYWGRPPERICYAFVPQSIARNTSGNIIPTAWHTGKSEIDTVC